MKTIAGLCLNIQAYLPHELLGYAKDDLEGILLSAEVIRIVNEEAQAESGTNKASQRARRAKVPKRVPRRRK